MDRFRKEITLTETRSAAAKQDVDTAKDADWAIAANREEVIASLASQPQLHQSDLERASQALCLRRSMIYKLVARYRQNPHTSALLNDRAGRKSGSRVLAKQVEEVVVECLKVHFLTPERPSVASLHRLIVAECRKAGLKAPSYKAVRSRIDSFDVKKLIQKRFGAKAARDRFQPVSAEGLRATRPLEVLQIDHTLIDVIAVDELERLPIGRPWLTLVIDVATRMVAGYYLSFDHPCATSVALAISHAVLPKNKYLQDLGIDAEWPVQGLPQIIHLDNAKEFHARALERGCQEHGIRLEYRPPLRPNFGGHIERLIGTLMGAVHLLPGTTFSSIKERGDYDSERRAAMTIPELELWLALQVAGVYHHAFHRGLAGKPIDTWKSSFDYSQTRRPNDVNRFYMDFLPFEPRLIRRDGIQLFRIHYWDHALTPLAGRSDRPFMIRYDPRDLSRVFVKEAGDDGYLVVPYRDLARPPITLMEHRGAMKELAKSKRLALTEDNVFNTIAAQRVLVQAARRKTATARRKASKPLAEGPSHLSSRKTNLSNEDYAISTEPVRPYATEVWDE